MLEKQIYTTARSEKIKRALSEYWTRAREEFIRFRQITKAKKIKTKSLPKIQKTVTAKERAQNIQISADSVQKNAVKTADRESLIYREKYFSKLSEEKIFSLVVYTIFIIIILIIGIAIWVSTSHFRVIK